MQNPLLASNMTNHTFDFKEITPQHFKEALPYLMNEAKVEFENSVLNAKMTYEGLLDSSPKLEHLVSATRLLYSFHSMLQTDEINEVYSELVPVVQAFFKEMALDNRGYFKLKEYKESEHFKTLDDLKKKAVNQMLKTYELSGINLPEEEKKKLQDISYELSELQTEFSNNLTSTEAKFELIFTKEELAGLSERAMQNTQVIKDEVTGEEKYLVSYSSGLYSDILNSCEVAETRKKVYEQQLVLGIGEGVDNRPLMARIVQLQHEKAKILGKKNYAHYALVDRMVKTPEEVLEFNHNLGVQSLDAAKKESQQVEEYGQKILGYKPEFHDRSFIIQRMEKELFLVDSEEQRKYFPVDHVLKELFNLVEELYGVQFIQNNNKSVWHEDVNVYDLVDTKTGKERGSIYMDLYKRKLKESGAWMSSIDSRNVNSKGVRLPICYVVCNAPKDVGRTSTFEFDEIITLFHEMGHALHNQLTDVDLDYFSGLNQVPQDAIELPSQFMENFCWDYEILKKISCHVENGDQLPFEEYQKMLTMKNFLSAAHMVRQVIFGELDMRIYNEPGKDPLVIEEEVNQKWKTRELDSRSIFSTSFTHIFTGGYSAGYYSYKWAEVLSSDAFHALKEAGNTYMEQKEVAELFKNVILARGGANDMDENFIEFRGRKPDVKYLLEDSGIVNAKLVKNTM